MAEPDKDTHESFLDTRYGIGQNADGTFNVFPASELAAKTAERDRDEAAIEYAIEQSEAGFPPEIEEDLDDVSDLDDEDVDDDEHL